MKKDDGNSFSKRRSDSDEAILNAKSFEQAKNMVRSRLKYLRADLAYKSPVEESLINELSKAHEDKKRKLMDIYARFYSPCKVSNTEYNPRAQCDMSDIMIDFSEGYDKFIKAMEEELVENVMRRRRATVLLSRMLSIKYPYSKVMYLYYYKDMKDTEISEKFFMSRSTFYRLKDVGIDLLTQMYYPSGQNTGDK